MLGQSFSSLSHQDKASLLLPPSPPFADSLSISGDDTMTVAVSLPGKKYLAMRWSDVEDLGNNTSLKGVYPFWIRESTEFARDGSCC